MALPVPERIEQPARPGDPRVARRSARTASEAGVFRRLADWGDYVLGDTYRAANEGLQGPDRRATSRPSGARRRSTRCSTSSSPTTCAPCSGRSPSDGDDGELGAAHARCGDDPARCIGGSDAGAHLDRMCGAPYTTRFLADMLRGRKLLPLERAVQLITQAPAQLFGLRDRGMLEEGALADVVLFDPETVGSEHATLVHDLPGDSARLTAGSIGVVAVFVNGVQTVDNDAATGASPGTLLRSGRDTDTVLPVSVRVVANRFHPRSECLCPRIDRVPSMVVRTRGALGPARNCKRKFVGYWNREIFQLGQGLRLHLA